MDSDEFENEDSEPWYDAEDIGCNCTEDGIDSDWNWNPDQGCYVCNGCGQVQ